MAQPFTRLATKEAMGQRPDDGTVDPRQITLDGGVQGRPEPEANRAYVVFVSLEVLWRRSLSDLGMNTSFAEHREDVFTSWAIDGRMVRLRNRPLRYRVELGDGMAQFMLDGLTAWDTAIGQVGDYLSVLWAHGRGTAKVRMTVQHLVPVEAEFEDLVDHLTKRVLNAHFYRSLGDTLDMAYFVDVVRNGNRHHVEVGPLRSHEIRQRTWAEHVDVSPDCSILSIVTGYFSASEDDGFSVGETMQDLRSFGQSLAEGLVP